MRFRKRGKYSFWHNPETITDIHVALELLADKSGTSEPVHLRTTTEFGWEIVLPWYTEGDSGGDRSGHHYFDVSKELAHMLRDHELVTPHIVIGWGFRRPDPSKLVLSSDGANVLEQYFANMLTRALAAIRPGIHTDLTGEPPHLRRSRDHRHSGALFFEFRTSQGQTARIYPEKNEIIMPYPPDHQQRP